MIYLLDVNVLLAWGYPEHVHHDRVNLWMRDLEIHDGDAPVFATCAITELGFVRIASGRSALAPNLAKARQDLRLLKASKSFVFLDESLEVEWLPDWVTISEQTTDGYLSELATAYGVGFATLDEGIPDAILIPKLPGIPGMVREPAIAYGWRAPWRSEPLRPQTHLLQSSRALAIR